jgi:hypothetical protein
MEQEQSEFPVNTKNTGLIAAGVSVGLILLIILQHNLAFQKSGTIVLPAGGTYLGPTDTQAPVPTAVNVATAAPTVISTPKAGSESYTTAEGKFAVGKDAIWIAIKGNKYPYSFNAPKALTLVALSQDQYDIYRSR